MKNKILIATTALVIIGVVIFFLTKSGNKEEWKEEIVTKGTFRLLVSASGAVQPENKISINPPISGRIDKLLSQEGEKVRKGQILAWMSSTDRAALLDSARAQSDSTAREWENEYKATPIVSPASGLIINRSVVEGQTISQTTVIFDLSDRLIIHADVDETDVGKIALNMLAEIKVDSYPDLTIEAKVLRIAHQSVLKNNINTYDITLLPIKTPKEIRSGMTATINFVLQNKEESILVPTWIADGSENKTIELQILHPEKKSLEKRSVKIGKSNGEYLEVLEGLQAGDIIRYIPQKIFNDGNAGSAFGFGSNKRRRN